VSGIWIHLNPEPDLEPRIFFSESGPDPDILLIPNQSRIKIQTQVCYQENVNNFTGDVPTGEKNFESKNLLKGHQAPREASSPPESS
jgi:hypothetical protein